MAVILDGSYGHELANRGFNDRELWATHALLTGPDAVRQLHLDYLEAGAEVLTTNTYSCVPLYLDRRPGLREQAPELLRLAANLAAEARATAGRPGVRIAASIPPLDESYRPDLVRPTEEMQAWYSMMVQSLDGLVDIWLCETMSSIEETLAAATACRPVRGELWVAWTVDDADPTRLRSGEQLRVALAALRDLEPDAVLVNCSTPAAIGRAVAELAGSGVAVGGYANGFPPVPADFSIETDVLADRPPELNDYLDHARQWVTSGASIIGGCCDIGPAHIAALAHALGDH